MCTTVRIEISLNVAMLIRLQVRGRETFSERTLLRTMTYDRSALFHAQVSEME